MNTAHLSSRFLLTLFLLGFISASVGDGCCSGSSCTPAELFSCQDRRIGKLERMTSCREGFEAINSGRLCMQKDMNPVDFMFNPQKDAGAILTCQKLGAHVCTYTEFMDACRVFNPYGDVQPGWYGDHGVEVNIVNGAPVLIGNWDDEFGTWNKPHCHLNNDGPTFDARKHKLPFRCCY